MSSEDKVILGKVAVRIRPLNDKEAGEGCWAVLELVDGEPQVFTQNTIQFFRSPLTMPSFLTFPMRSSMMDREEDCEAVIYWLQCGQTGSGKTLSRGTTHIASDDPALHSVIPRSVRDIFKYIADHSELSFKVGVSFMELYNEQIFDLLSLKSRREETIVDIQEDGNKGIKIPGLRLTSPPWTTHWASWRRPVG